MNSASIRPAYMTWTGRCLTLAPESTLSAALDALPRLHARSTVIPPRTRAPRIEPEGHCAGSAGSKVITSGEEMLGTSGACKRAFCKHRSVLTGLIHTTSSDGHTYHHGSGEPKVCINLEYGIRIKRVVQAEQVRGEVFAHRELSRTAPVSRRDADRRGGVRHTESSW